MLAIAALSARALTEAALADGHQVLALDVFGDVDTQRAAAAWRRVGDCQTDGQTDGHTDGQTDGNAQRINQALLCAGLQHAASLGASGWIAGSGFELDPDLLLAGAAVLPLIGNPAPVWHAVRDPAQFFGCLQAAGLPHPAWRASVPGDSAPADSAPTDSAPDGAGHWLVKDPGSSGGSAVQHLAQWRRSGLPLPATAYVQRLLPGQPVSLTFIANGQRALVLGANQQQVQALAPTDGSPGGGRPFSFAGVIGPVALPAAAEALLREALDVLVARFQLRGLGSLDALLDGAQIHLLELNPRPPASLQLYPAVAGHGVVAAHVAACRHGHLPARWPPGATHRTHPAPVRGLAVVQAPQALQIDGPLSARLAAWPGVQDVPQPGTRLAAGDPLCSLHTSAASATAVQAALQVARARLLQAILTSADPAWPGTAGAPPSPLYPPSLPSPICAPPLKARPND